jgi:NAD(P)-dependent dehydrogenase (short-subunit alcohol dehydrogenase family)
MKPLEGKVAVVAGATRGAGRGIAVELGAAGATVYCTGRSVRGRPSDLNRAETIDETAELVTEAGGKGIAVRIDHTKEEEVRALFEKVRTEQDGQLDVLVNDVWGGESLISWGKPFWEQDLGAAAKLLERAVFSHIITSRYGVPLMIARGSGLVIEIGDGDTLEYRGNFLYDFVKTSVIRLAFAMAEELRGNVTTPIGETVEQAKTTVTALALTPGYLRSEAMLEGYGVTEANWQDAAKIDPNFIASETPHFVGRAVVALAADPNVHEKSGGAFSSWGLSDEYGFTDVGGAKPHWGRHFEGIKQQEQVSLGRSRAK